VKSRGTSEVGRFKAVRTSSIVIKAALGIDAAPTLASVAVKLGNHYHGNLNLINISRMIQT